jgi:putative transposase
VKECTPDAGAPASLPAAPLKVSVSNLLNSHKGVSSRLLRKERPDIHKRYWKGVLWSPSYFASSCGGAPISIIRQYMEQQRTPH